jgi:hypothetical protein
VRTDFTGGAAGTACAVSRLTVPAAAMPAAACTKWRRVIVAVMISSAFV